MTQQAPDRTRRRSSPPASPRSSAASSTEPPAARRTRSPASQSVEDFKAGFALNASTAVARAEPPVDAARRTRRTSTRWALLGLAYQQRARETGDPAYYTKSDGALRRALALDAERLARRTAASARSRSRATASREALALGEQAPRARADDARATTA